ncbi:MAG: hypothetical protein PWP71_2590 [Clostridia bacterium]|nr:hypothetical protein [Clostridia bacterium]
MGFKLTKKYIKRIKNRSTTHTTLGHWMDFRFRLFMEGITVGLLAGFVVIFYRFLLEKAEIIREDIYTYLNTSGVWFSVLWFVVLTIIALIIGYLVRKEPLISGSGIPQVKGILLSQLKMNWLRVLAGKFFGGILAIGAGLSLGREGPSVQLGATIGQGFSRIMGRLSIEEKYLVTSGASAGLAAAFNAPLAGVIFALEEMHKNFSPLVLTSAMAASLTADFLSQRFFGIKPIFTFEALPTLPLNYYFYLIILGLIIGIFGVIFNSTLVSALNIYNKIKLPNELRPLLPLLMAGFLGMILPETLGGGHHLVNLLGNGHFTIKMLLVLMVIKFLFTMVSYGSGVPGGIFLPLLVIGALAGNIYGNIIIEFFHIDPQFNSNFIVLAMAAYFTAIVKAPITGSILITEMTGSFSHLLAMITVSMTAYVVTDLLNSKPIYEVLLERILKNKGPNGFIGEDKKKSIIEVAVCLGSMLDGKRIKDIQWPPFCLLVGIKRGENEIIPNGNTKIFVGDYLIVLTNEDQEAEAKQRLLEMAGECDFHVTVKPSLS